MTSISRTGTIILSVFMAALVVAMAANQPGISPGTMSSEFLSAGTITKDNMSVKFMHVYKGLGIQRFLVTVLNERKTARAVSFEMVLDQLDIDAKGMSVTIKRLTSQPYNFTNCTYKLNETCAGPPKNVTCWNDSIVDKCWNVELTRDVWVELKPKSASKSSSNIDKKYNDQQLPGNLTEVYLVEVVHTFKERPDGWGSTGTMTWELDNSSFMDKSNSSWWNVSYAYRWEIFTNGSLAWPVTFKSKNGDHVTTMNNVSGEHIYWYCENADGTGLCTVANDTAEHPWENHTSLTGSGNDWKEVWNESLVLRFHMENTSEQDRSRTWAAFTLKSTPISRSGQLDNSTDYDGADDLRKFYNNLTLARQGIAGTVFTVAFWTNYSSLGGGTGSSVMGQYASAAQKPRWYIEYTGDATGTLKVDCNDGNNHQLIVPTQTNRSLVDGWFHHVYTFNGTCGTLYVNGTPEYALCDASHTNCSAPAEYLTFGGIFNGIDTYYYSNGQLDEVNIWNQSFYPAEASFMYDNDALNYAGLGPQEQAANAPVVTVYNSTFNSTVDTFSIDFNFTDDGASSSCDLLLNGTPYDTNSSVPNATYAVLTTNASLPDDDYSVIVECNDGANKGNSTAIIAHVDSHAPDVDILVPGNSTYTTLTPDLKVSANETISTWVYENCTGDNVTFTPNGTMNACEGSNDLYVYANDTLGNLGSDNVQFTVDSQGPVITVSIPTNGTITVNYTELNISTDENANWCGFSRNGTANVTMTNTSGTAWTYNATGLFNATGFLFTFSCNDTYGTTGATQDAYVYVSEGVDSDPPNCTGILRVGTDNNGTDYWETSIYFGQNVTIVYETDENCTCYLTRWNLSYDSAKTNDSVSNCSVIVSGASYNVTCDARLFPGEKSHNITRYLSCQDDFGNKHTGADCCSVGPFTVRYPAVPGLPVGIVVTVGMAAAAYARWRNRRRRRR